MKDKILEALKNKFKNLGFGEKAFDGVASFLEKTVTEETEIDNAVSGVEPLLKAFQGDIDKRVTDAVTKTKKELEKSAPEKKEQPEKKTETDEIPGWAKSMMQKLEKYEQKDTQERLLSKFKTKVKDKVPESFLKGRQITIESENDIDTLVSSVESDYNDFKQELINQGVYLENPKNATGQMNAGVAFAERTAEARNKRTSAGVEGKAI